MTASSRSTLFRYSEYERFLRHVVERYRVFSLASWDGGPGVVLRHDVDLDVRAAHRLAAIDARCGATASFLFLTTAPSYNVLSRASTALIREIALMGFDVGVHFDPTARDATDEDSLRAALRRDADLLQSITGRAVASVSIHNPSVHGKYLEFPGFRNAYSEAIFGPDRYLSDSRMIIRSDPYEFVKRAESIPIQLLFHPLHFSDTGEGYPAIFDTFVADELRMLDTTFRVISTFDAEVKPDLLENIAPRLRGTSTVTKE